MSAHHLAGLAEDALHRLGDRDALVYAGRTWRSAELHDRAVRAAAGLQRLGVGPGDRVGVLMANCPEVGIGYTAIWRAGAVVTPIVFLITPPELQHILVDSGAVGVVTTPELLPVLEAAAPGAPALRFVVVVGEGTARLPDGVDLLPFEALEAGGAAEIVDRADDDLAALLYTGGTTGRSKGVMLSHRNLWSISKSAHDASYVPGLTRTLVPLPLSHAYGLIVSLVGMHAVEPGLSVLQRWFDPAEFLALAAEHRVQRTTLVPAMVQMLLAQPLEDADLASLRYATSGAAPLAAETLHEFERRVPSVEVLEGYGLTESAAVIATNPPGARRIGSVGRPLPGVEVRVVDPAGSALPPGEDGEICARSSGVMQGYWNAPDVTGHALRDGWLHTGDVGHLDDDGYLYVVDRLKDLIIRGGFNIYPRDVEDVLLEHPAVSMAAVVGRPDPRLGEEAVAFVSLRPGASASEADLVAHARERLSAHKYPREVHVLDAVPLTSVGKLDRKALRARLAGG